MLSNSVVIILPYSSPGKRYPFYGVQWHPEVNPFQWDRKLNFPHSRHAVQLSSLLAAFFSNEGNVTITRYTNSNVRCGYRVRQYNWQYNFFSCQRLLRKVVSGRCGQLCSSVKRTGYSNTAFTGVSHRYKRRDF